MKILFLYTMLLFSLSAIAVEPHQKIDSVVIKIAPWDIITDIAIESSNFETSIDYQVYTEQNPSMICKLINELNHLNKSMRHSEDMRCKIIFYYSGEIIESNYIGKKTTKIGFDYYYTSPSLIAIIDSIVNNSATPPRKEFIEAWDATPMLKKIYRYLACQSERLYKGIEITEDLEFTVFCNVGEDGKTTDVHFSKNKQGKDKQIPAHVISVLQEILYKEVKWDVPSNFYSQWVPLNILVKAKIVNDKMDSR